MSRQQQNRVSLLLLFLSCVLVRTSAYGTGASTAACTTLSPSHGVAARSPSSNPYELMLSDVRIVSGSEVTLSLVKKNNVTADFKGFMVQARDLFDEALLGEFVVMDDAAKHMACTEEMPKATLSHAGNSTKTDAVFKWKTPGFKTGGDRTIRFDYTVVQTMTVFWTGQTADSMLHVMENPTAPSSSGGGDGGASSSGDKCFEGKGCFGLPAGCERENGGTDCKGLLKYSANADDNKFFDFELHSKSNAEDSYHAVGFSSDQSMGGDLVIACLSDRVSLHWTTSPNKGAKLLFTLNSSSTIEHSVENLDGGRRVCKLRYTAKTDINVPTGTEGAVETKTFDFKADTQYLMQSTGNHIQGQLTYHLDSRVVSTAKVDLNSIKDQLKPTKSGVLEMGASLFVVGVSVALAKIVAN